MRDGDGTGMPEPVGDGDGFNFSSLLGMGRVTDKYIRIGYGDGECKTCPHPAPMPCLESLSNNAFFHDYVNQEFLVKE